MLYSVSLITNFVFLIAAVWLGVYVVTRSQRSHVAWLTGLTLWSVSGLFLNMLLALNPPLLLKYLPTWAQLILPFWPVGTLDGGWSGWLKGWLIMPAIIFWHHVTILIRPGGMNRWRWVRVLFGYLVALAAILVYISTPLVFSSVSGGPLYLNTLKPGPLYPIFIAFLLLFTALSLINLLRSAQTAPSALPRKQLLILAAATLTAGFSGLVGWVAVAFNLILPRVILSLFLGVSVVLIGYGVARYSALMEGRTMRRDFIYNAVAMSLVTILYLGMTWISVRIFNVPAAVFVFMVLLAVVTHSVIDVARYTLDSFFYHRENLALRANLRRLASQVGEHSLEENLGFALASMCTSVRATYGLILLFERDGLHQAAAYRWHGSVMSLAPNHLLADDVLQLELGQLPAPLTETVLLIPIYTSTEQIGAVIFGRPVNGIHYSNADIELLLSPSDRLADAILSAQREAEFITKLAQLTQTEQLTRKAQTEQIPLKVVEDALRNLFDFAELGDSQLAKTKLVSTRFPPGSVTHIDRGKVVHDLITEAVDKLRPESQLPGDPAPRQWHPYLILHDAYLEEKLNRDIMSRLYISEGTFNRTRRAAIRAVARVLEEMEAAIN